MKIWKMLVLFLPVIELLFLLFLGKSIGVMNTVLVLLLAGFLGIVLAKREGINTLKSASEQMRNGLMPGPEILDGICIMIGALLLLIPGIFSDFLAFIFLIPITRKIMKPVVIYWLNKLIAKGRFVVINR
ncbi:MAG: fxsA [Bacillales bacterium]|jgi:UPF0716 protein FxsA|nr:fxsA [Bacillales bacterium]